MSHRGETLASKIVDDDDDDEYKSRDEEEVQIISDEDTDLGDVEDSPASVTPSYSSS